MLVRLAILFALVAGAASLARAGADDPAAAAAKTVDFSTDVLAVFTEHCHACHGGIEREGGLRLDRGRDALAGGDGGRVIVPGDPDQSRLIQYVRGDDPEHVMPPEGEGERLPAEAIDLLARWIRAGAVWPAEADAKLDGAEHWAFQPLAAAPPPGAAGHLLHGPIDAFVQERLMEQGIEPSAEADRVTLIRRLSYDLIGLPPSPADVAAFVSDARPDAYDRLVDRLLLSPEFGERWGRHWLDTARYADSDGYEKDNPRYHAWKYRDWVIEAVNADLPFDEFTVQQLAGDLLPQPTAEQLLATAFNRQTLTNTEGGTDQEQFRVEAVFDRVETIGTAWLGLTVGCARCHTHKYDPISQREYYQLFAFFNNADEATDSQPSSSDALVRYERERAAWQAELDRRKQPLTARRAALEPGLVAWAAEQQRRVTEAANAPVSFTTVVPKTAKSQKKAELAILEDGAVRASGARPVQDVYLLTLPANVTGITGLRLEALSDETLPAKGPGRADHGNFVLSEIAAEIVATGDAADEAADDAGEEKPAKGVVLKFAGARSDFAQEGFSAALAIDGKKDETGWAVAPQFGQDHFAVFALAPESVEALATARTGARVRVRLHQNYKSSPHTLGKFRLSWMTGEDQSSLGLSDELRAAVALPPEQWTDAQRSALLERFASEDAEYSKLAADALTWEKQAPFEPVMPVAVIRERTAERRATRMLSRGDFLQPLDEVAPETLEVLPPIAKPAPADAAESLTPTRLDLARWLVSPENPLTPRVVVNQVWQHLFGRGLVKTVNDFGTRGEPPTHPALLDWLASEYQRQGWSRKALIREIVLSHTYRQSSAHRPELAEVDPQNTLLARQNRFRVEAEIVRDLHLAASGLLDRRIGGPSVFPTLPPGIAELSYADNFKWGTSDWNTRPDRLPGLPPQEDKYRRGMYTFFKRTAPHPNLTTFDCPDATATMVERSSSNTPLQALVTLNNETFVEAARALARRVAAGGESHDGERVQTLLQFCVARPPAAEESAALIELLNEGREYYRAHPDQAAALSGPGWPTEIAAADAAAWTATARVVLNLDEFITRE